jgi:hypothetical protein
VELNILLAVKVWKKENAGDFVAAALFFVG